MKIHSHVLVVGSANVDISVTARELPLPGQTVIGDGSVIGVGGKGANQAAAAAGCGATTQFVARVGADAFGRMVTDELGDRGIDVGNTKQLADAATGLAAIYVDHSGQNCIVVVPGANSRLSPSDIDASLPLIRDAAVVIVQCEIPLETVYRTVELAASEKKLVILNPAPAHQLDLGRIVGRVSYLVPNETEASQLSGIPVESVSDAERCAKLLHQKGIACVIITLGARGCVVADEHDVRHIPPHRVAAVYTTGAGDAFIGCLAASLAAGLSQDDAIRRAVVYSALSTTKRGALVSYPTGEAPESLSLSHST
jgi:ribokinase